MNDEGLSTRMGSLARIQALVIEQAISRTIGATLFGLLGNDQLSWLVSLFSAWLGLVSRHVVARLFVFFGKATSRARTHSYQGEATR